MLELYKKMYATVVGRVDADIDILEDAASQETCDKERVLQVAQDLRQTLLKVEEMYLDAADGELE